MVRLFGSRRDGLSFGDNPLNHISFPLNDWIPQVCESPLSRVWKNSAGDILSLDIVPVRHNESRVPNLAETNDYMRALSDRKGHALLEFHATYVCNIQCFKFITKQPKQPSGFIFAGTLAIPRRDFSFRLSLFADEHGMTGIREAFVWELARRENRVRINDDEIEGWNLDPSARTSNSSCARNLADSEEYDTRFPNHPLSRTRRYLREFEAMIRIADCIQRAPPYWPHEI